MSTLEGGCRPRILFTSKPGTAKDSIAKANRLVSVTFACMVLTGLVDSTNSDISIGVGRFRILGGPRFRILGGPRGGQIPSRHMTS